MLIAFCSFLFFFSMGVRIINKIHLENQTSQCVTHKWETYNGQMVCVQCKKTPEELRR